MMLWEYWFEPVNLADSRLLQIRFDQLGKSGWELVSFVYDGSTKYAVFKRWKSNGRKPKP